MPRIIRTALYQKFLQMQEMVQFSKDFALATGLELQFVDELGDSTGRTVPLSPLCTLIQYTPAGQRLCRQAHTQVLSAAATRPACLTCDAGCVEAAVPLRVSGIVIGYLKIAGVTSHPFAVPDLQRIQHLMRKADVVLDIERFKSIAASTRIVSPELLQAYLRILDIAAQQMALRMTAHLTNPAVSMPKIVDRACREIRRRALTDDLSLDDVAAECEVSPSYLSRTFHHATGLTFREYVARWRAEHAHNKIVNGNEPITQIAYASGFQSLSQFNRVFRSCYGKSPRRLREEIRRTPAKP